MSFVLILGIIFMALPAVTMVVLSFIIFANFVRDDGDTAALFYFGLGMMGFGALLIAIHFIGNSL